MLNRITSHVRGNAVAYVALFTALGGTSYAAVQLAPGSVTSRALANGAVTHSKLAARSVSEGNFKPGALQNALRAMSGAKGATGSGGMNGAGGPSGPAGSNGAAGHRGSQGPAGHDGSASVVLRARGTGKVSGPHGATTDVPLTGGSWTQAANDLNLITGSVTIQIPQTCTGSFGNAVVMSVDGVPNTFAVAPTAPANATVTVPVVVSEVMEPGADAHHAITAKLQNSCTKSGEDYVLTDARLDVVNFH
jgi:hypothetical protein